jgi:glycosyltransferase involved in cell wall biosynthesis
MPMQRPLARLVLRRADLLITHGQGTVEQLRELGIDREALVVSMPPTLDLLPVRQQPRPPLRLLFLGFVRPYKGVGVAIDAMRVLQQEKVAAQLTVAGEFWDPVDGYRQQVSDLGLQDRVELRTGYLTDVEVRDILATHHIVVAPYLDDTLSGIVPLAFAAGRPVVSTAVGGISEQVADGHNGILVKPGDPEALAAGIQVAAERLEELSAGAVESSSSWALVAAAVTSSFQLPPRAADEVTPRGFNAHRN